MIPYGKHHIDDDDIAAVVKLMKSGWLTQGPTVELFEKHIADYVGAKYAVAVSSGSVALHMTLLAAGLNEKSKVVTSPITFVSSANAALYIGATPLFCDINSDTVNMSVESLSEKIKKQPDIDAIIPVHFSGVPCDMKRIKRVADENGMIVIEDAAHALGSNYIDGGKVGNCKHSLMTVFSFHPVKTIAAGEGGMITTNDEGLYRKLLRLRSHGINKLDDPYLAVEEAYTGEIRNPWYYEMRELGFNYRITDIQCALALSQLKKVDKFVSRRREIAKMYDSLFQDVLHCQPINKGCRDVSSNHLYVLLIDFKSINTTRAEFMLNLRSQGVGSQVHYIPVPLQPFYSGQGYNANDYPNAMAYYAKALSIPLFYDLTDEQMHHVVEVIKELII